VRSLKPRRKSRLKTKPVDDPQNRTMGGTPPIILIDTIGELRQLGGWTWPWGGSCGPGGARN